MVSLLDLVLGFSVSSCSDPKEFGKKCLTDGREDTCWSSKEGTRQWVKFRFKEPVDISEVKITFQGGFTCRTMKIQSLSEENVTNEVSVNPTDCNSCQTFPVIDMKSVNCLRILFEEMSDFYGRIVIYGLDIIGNKLP